MYCFSSNIFLSMSKPKSKLSKFSFVLGLSFLFQNHKQFSTRSWFNRIMARLKGSKVKIRLEQFLIFFHASFKRRCINIQFIIKQNAYQFSFGLEQFIHVFSICRAQRWMQCAKKCLFDN